MSDHPYLEHDGPIPFAHRGGDRHAPENTMAAFEHAVEVGFRHLETDVHLSADGQLVAFHDVDLSRTCGVDAKISDLSWAEIAELRVDGREPIPTMRDLLTRWPDHRFNIDCKADIAERALVSLIDELDALDRVCLGAFSHRRLQRLRKQLGRRLLTCLSPTETATLVVSGRLPGTSQRAAQVPVRQGPVPVVTSRFLGAARRHGTPVHVWTVNDRDEMERLLDLGVDGIMTDDVEALREVMDSRGVWRG